MSHAWSAELVVSSALAQSLIETQFPQLVPVKAESIGAGFDNTAFCVNSAHIFRFPRRQFAVQFLEAETRLTILAYASDVGDADLVREGQVSLRHLAGV